jgi:molybdopterin-guanine dinucleotide biosynthesis protein A
VQPIVDALDAGRRRVISFFGDVKVRYVETEEIKCFDPAGGTFFNINTLADLAAARELAASYPLPKSR